MKKTSRLTSVALLALSLIFPLIAGGEEAKLRVRLEAGDVERFIATFPAMVKDMKALGADLGEVENPTAIQGLMANEKVQEILARYGWSQTAYLEKVTAIAAGYAALRMEAELAALPAEQREMVKSMMGAQMSQLLQVHPADLKQVQQHKAGLDAFFESN